MKYIIDEEELKKIFYKGLYVDEVRNFFKDRQPIELVAEGKIDEVCKQFGKWSCYKDSNDKYKIYIQEGKEKNV